jgi:hypothetical protein
VFLLSLLEVAHQPTILLVIVIGNIVFIITSAYYSHFIHPSIHSSYLTLSWEH